MGDQVGSEARNLADGFLWIRMWSCSVERSAVPMRWIASFLVAMFTCSGVVVGKYACLHMVTGIWKWSCGTWWICFDWSAAMND